ncbi:hypothetical protein ACCS64_26600 [Rhizobium ruizarguesonis]
MAAEILVDQRERYAIHQFSAAEFASNTVDYLIAEIERRRQLENAAHRRSSRDNEQSYLITKWDHALSLLSERDKYYAALVKEFELFILPSSPEERAVPALRTALRQLLEKARRKLALATEHRIRVWEKIRPISDDVHRQNGRVGLGSEITDEHIIDVHRRLSALYPESGNFRLSVDAVKGYFIEFHPGFLNQLDVEDAPDESFSEIFLEEYNQTLQVGPCLQQLQKAAPDTWETLIIKFDLGDLPKISVEKFKLAKSLTRTQFDKILKKGLQLMAECLEKTTNFRFRGME